MKHPVQLCETFCTNLCETFLCSVLFCVKHSVQLHDITLINTLAIESRFNVRIKFHATQKISMRQLTQI